MGINRLLPKLVQQFGFEKVAFTLRSSTSASDNEWAGILFDGKRCYFSKEYHLHIVDRVAAVILLRQA